MDCGMLISKEEHKGPLEYTSLDKFSYTQAQKRQKLGIDSFYSDSQGKSVQIIPREKLIEEANSEMGCGAYANVYEMEYGFQAVAVKKPENLVSSLKKKSVKNLEKIVWIFEQEASIMFELKHENILWLIGVVNDSKTDFWIVTEYCNHGSLTHCLDLFKKDVLTLLKIAIDIAKGLEFIHSKDYIHFDLKPDNILVTQLHKDMPIAKIGDFGCAKKMPVEAMGKAPGTKVYMAPELAEDSHKDKKPTHKRLLDQKVDIYSFGILLYNMFSSECAYNKEMMELEHLKSKKEARAEIFSRVVRDNLRPDTKKVQGDAK